MPRAIGCTPMTLSTTATVMKPSPPMVSTKDSKFSRALTRHRLVPRKISLEDRYEADCLPTCISLRSDISPCVRSCRKGRSRGEVFTKRHHSYSGQGALFHAHCLARLNEISKEPDS